MREIPLTYNKVAFIDDDDFDALSKYSWAAEYDNGLWYAVTRMNGKRVFMHRFILGTPKGKHTDHKDGNGLNNCRSNIRVATASQNGANRGLGRNNKSGFKGVCWATHVNKWKASISVNGRDRALGYFNDKIEAAKAYDSAARVAFGEFARPNFA